MGSTTEAVNGMESDDNLFPLQQTRGKTVSVQRLGAHWSDSRQLRRFTFNGFYFPLQRAVTGRKRARGRFLEDR